MNKAILLNVLINIIFSIVFIYLNIWALQNNLEETFISLALLYGAVVVIGNALYIYIFYRK